MRHFKIHYAYMRDPKTTQEKRANQDSEYARAKRRPSSLPHAWDDIWVRGRKTWKDRRQTQYRESRGEKHTIKITDRLFYEWSVKQYFEKLDIPHQFETIRLPEYRQEFVWRQVRDKDKERFDSKYSQGFQYKHYKEYTGRIVRCSVFDHYLLTWWSDKDIGIDYILQSTQSSDFEGYEDMPA